MAGPASVQRVPTILTPTFPPNRLHGGWRLLCAGLAAGLLAILVAAAMLPPSPSGMGTHHALGLAECQFLVRTGLPCPTCGMTTSFAWMTRGQIGRSAQAQPAGTILALAVAAGFWTLFYMAVTGRPVHRLLWQADPVRIILGGAVLIGLAWGYKVLAVVVAGGT
jgi:hypothetical protein